MRTKQLLGLVAVLVLGAACADLPTELQSDPSDYLTAAAAPNRVIGSARGSGHAECAPGPAPQCFPGGGLRTFSFNANMHADGSVTGRAQHNNREIDTKVKLDIECVNFFGVDENRAWLIGTVTHSDDPGLPVGAKAGFAVADNGEGNGADPDQISGIGFAPPGIAAYVCSGADPANILDPNFALFGFNIQSGNIQVDAPGTD